MKKENKKVLFIDHDPDYTGSTVSMLYIIKAFSNRSFGTGVLTPKSGELLSIFNELNTNLFTYRIRYLSTTMLDLHFLSKKTGFMKIIKNSIKFTTGFILTINAILKYKPDLVYVNEYVSLQSAVAARFLGIPVITHVRSLFIEEGLRNRFIRWAIPEFSRLVVAISEPEKEQFHINSSDIIIIREFLSEKDFCNYNNERIRDSHNIPAGRSVVLNLGGIASFKGTLDYLKAAELVIADGHDYLFILAGKAHTNEQEYYNTCMSIINRYPDNIRFTGIINNSHELISVCDVFVSSNTISHFSRPVIEAWAQSKPVIAYITKHSDLYIRHLENGILVENNEFKSMGDWLIRIIENPELASTLGRNGYSYAMNLFSAEKNLNEIVDRAEYIMEQR